MRARWKGAAPRAGGWILAGVTPDGLCDLAGTLASEGFVSLIYTMGP